MNKWTFIVLLALLIGVQPTAVGEEPSTEDLERGKEIVFSRGRGNCLACHAIEGGDLAGDYGPPLLLMKVRYPEREALRAQIWDASVKEPLTRMPPYGRHRILTEAEIDLVVDFIYSL